MIKKNLFATVLVTIFMICLGQFLKGYMEDYGILDMRTVSDMEKIPFEFDAILDADDEGGFQEYHDEYVAEALAEEFIAVVCPTGTILQRNGTLKQEVYVAEMVSGDSNLKEKTIFLQGGNGVQHYFLTQLDENGEEYASYSDNNIYYIGVENIMRPDNTYVAFFHNIQMNDFYVSDLYELNGIFAYFKLNAGDYFETVSLDKVYTLEELKEFEYFCTSASTLQRIYRIKNDILDSMKVRYQVPVN